MRRARRPQRGITVIELMVALVVLGFITAPVLGCVSIIRQNAVEARTQALVLALARTNMATKMSQKGLAAFLSSLSSPNVAIAGGIAVNVSTVVTAIGGYRSLYKVTTTATYTAPYNNDRANTLVLESYEYSP